jgi:sulfur-oxidizing protein SoxX
MGFALYHSSTPPTEDDVKTPTKMALGAALMLSLSATSASGATGLEEGKQLAFDRKKGNCLACHVVGDGQAPGDIGPPLVAMQQRFPDKARLRAQIFDATAANAETRMPPFGRHHILSGDEIDKITDYIHSL